MRMVVSSYVIWWDVTLSLFLDFRMVIEATTEILHLYPNWTMVFLLQEWQLIQERVASNVIILPHETPEINIQLRPLTIFTIVLKMSQML